MITYKYKALLWSWMLLGILVSCRFIPELDLISKFLFGAPQVTNHPAPTLTIDTEIFTDTGCPEGDDGHRTCTEDSPLTQIGCEKIVDVDNFIGGLDPTYPIILCYYPPPKDDRWDVEETEYIYKEGCTKPFYVRYVVYRDGGFQLIKNISELQAVFAPIESPDEALSYAIATTGYSAYYDIKPERGYRYHVDELEDSYVTETEEGYNVHLFYYQWCGCGPHTTSAVDVYLSRSGDIKPGSYQPLFEDPEEDNLCID